MTRACSLSDSVIKPRSVVGVGRIGSPRRMRPSVAMKRIRRFHGSDMFTGFYFVFDIRWLYLGLANREVRGLEGYMPLYGCYGGDRSGIPGLGYSQDGVLVVN